VASWFGSPRARLARPGSRCRPDPGPPAAWHRTLPALQQILGHATLAMTMRYSHLSPKRLRDEMAKTERQPELAEDDVTEATEVRAQARAQEGVPVA